MTRFSLTRKLTDYTKVQVFIGGVIRGKEFWIDRKRIRDLEYLDIGCGPNVNPDFVNLDYEWRPKVDVCWDLIKKDLPFPDNRFKGIYTEHCFEHLPFND